MHSQKEGWSLLAEKHQSGGGGMTYCRLLHEAGLQPLSDAVQVQVDAHQAQLPSPLDQLVRLHHQPLEETDKYGFISAGPTGDCTWP